MSCKEKVIQIRVSNEDYLSFKESRLHISHVCRMALREAVFQHNKGNAVPCNGNAIHTKKDAVKAWNKIQNEVLPLISHQELIEIYHSTYPIREFYQKTIKKVTGSALQNVMNFIHGDEISEEILKIVFKDLLESEETSQEGLLCA